MMKRIYLAGGCFWGVEKYLSLIPGVVKTEVGYANGNTANPSYEDVRYHDSGHAETVLVEYDEKIIPLPRLLELFFDAIDPTSLNRQGEDEGIQYRTGIYYAEETDREAAEASLAALKERITGTVVVEVRRLDNYHPAEERHQKYLEKNPTGYCHIGADLFCRFTGA
jgi:peptide methionine sulfoxide reductase msrA/msrB